MPSKQISSYPSSANALNIKPPDSLRVDSLTSHFVPSIRKSCLVSNGVNTLDTEHVISILTISSPTLPDFLEDAVLIQRKSDLSHRESIPPYLAFKTSVYFVTISNDTCIIFGFRNWQSFMGEGEMLSCLGGKLESFGFEFALSGSATAEFSGLCRRRSDGVH